MEMITLKKSTTEIEDYTPNGKVINNGRKAEIAFKYEFTNTIDYSLDNVSYVNGGDFEYNSEIYQVKSNNSEINLLKTIKDYNFSSDEIIEQYLYYNKATKYAYVLTFKNKSYAIIMDKEEFKEFVKEFYKYKENRKSWKIKREDKSIYVWYTLRNK